jgi:hypothetical protein
MSLRTTKSSPASFKIIAAATVILLAVLFSHQLFPQRCLKVKDELAFVHPTSARQVDNAAGI